MAKSKSKPKFSPELLDELLKGQDPKTVLSSAGLFGDLKKALAERMLNCSAPPKARQIFVGFG